MPARPVRCMRAPVLRNALAPALLRSSALTCFPGQAAWCIPRPQVCHALGDIGIDAPTLATLWRTLAGVLWLGDLDFEANGDDATNDSTKVI